jgi:hypothetical protein
LAKHRRHHNRHALTQIKRGYTENQLKRIAARLKIPYATAAKK